MSVIYSTSSPTATLFGRRQYRPTGLGTRPNVPGWPETVRMLRVALATAKTRAPQSGGPSAENVACAVIDRIDELGVRNALLERSRRDRCPDLIAPTIATAFKETYPELDVADVLDRCVTALTERLREEFRGERQQLIEEIRTRLR